MFYRILFLLLVFCTLTSSAQEIDMSAFSSKVKVVKNKIPLAEVRESQKGFLLDWSISVGKKGSEYRLMYIKESFIPFGIYTGFGRTEVFTNTVYAEFRGKYGETLWGRLPMNYSDKDWPKKWSYISMGLSKNLTKRFTIYVGYSRILGIDREEEYFPRVQWEEQNIIDFGFILRGKKMSCRLGLPIHLPYYDMSKIHQEVLMADSWGDSFIPADGGIKIRPQIGIGYNF